MTDLDPKEPESSKPKPKPDDSAAHSLSVFAQSLAYSAVEAPSRGAAQIADHIFGTTLDETIRSKFANAGIQKPKEEGYGTHAWAAEQLGAAIGMVLPLKISRLATVGKADQTLTKIDRIDEGFAAQQHSASVIDKAVREARLSTRTGLFYGAVLSPTDTNDKNTSTGDFLLGRIDQGSKNAITFGAMGASSAASSELLGRAANALEFRSIPPVFQSPLQTALHSNLLHGSLSGIPGGVIQAQLNAMENGKPLASLQDIKENVVSMTMIGGAMGSAKLFQDPSAKSEPVSLFAPAKNPLAKAPSYDFTSNLDALRPASQASNVASEATTWLGGNVYSRNQTQHMFDIDYSRGSDAWEPDFVKKHMTVESRPIEFAAPGREQAAKLSNWEDFKSWGIETREVPVNVYRFPGLKVSVPHRTW